MNVDVDKCDQHTCSMIWDKAKENANKKKEVPYKQRTGPLAKDFVAKDSKSSLSKRKREIVEKGKSKSKDIFKTNSNEKKETFKLPQSTKHVVPKSSQSSLSREKSEIIEKSKNKSNNLINSYEKNEMSQLPRKPAIQTEPKKFPSREGSKIVKFGERSESKLDHEKCAHEDHLKISLERDSSQFTKLSNTPSGSLAMELDEKIIKQIQQKMQKSSSLQVTLLKTESGHLKIDFSPDISSANSQKINVNKSSSGALVFEVDKKFANVLKSGVDMYGKKLEVEKKSSLSVAITPKQNKKGDKTSDIQEVIEKSTHVCKTESDIQLEAILDANKLDKMNDIKFKSEVLKLKKSSGNFNLIEAKITNTESGNTAFVITDLSSLGIPEQLLDKYPVLLSKSPSGSYLLDVKSAKPNATIRRTRSGKFLVVITDSVSKSMENINKKCTRVGNGIFKLSIKDGKQKIENLPVVLKSTPSDNFLAVVDKEYEAHYKAAIKDQLDPQYECPVELVKCSSTAYILNVDDNNPIIDTNAILVRSSSGNVKIIPQASNKHRDITMTQTLRKNSTKIFENLLQNVPHKIKKPIVSRPTVIETKSSSDSNLYEKVKLRLENQNLLKEPSALLKKTSSGQYSVVLNKESKKTFINNLKSYLSNHSQGLIPIKRTESGEITIVLNNDNESKGQYGSLKITPSGNIYVLVNEKVINSIIKDGTVEKPQITENKSRSHHDIDTNENPVNKVVTTTCNALPDSCSCDPSKCVCADLLKHGVTDCYFQPCRLIISDEKRSDLKCQHKCCDCGQPTENSEYVTPPHIVIKPSGGRPKTQKDIRDDDQSMFYVTEAVCPFHKDRYDSLSNELLEISGLCNRADETDSDKSFEIITTPESDKKLIELSNLDYLDNLPPQLPLFLRNFKCA